jgi:hypothetical protein
VWADAPQQIGRSLGLPRHRPGQHLRPRLAQGPLQLPAAHRQPGLLHGHPHRGCVAHPYLADLTAIVTPPVLVVGHVGQHQSMVSNRLRFTLQDPVQPPRQRRTGYRHCLTHQRISHQTPHKVHQPCSLLRSFRLGSAAGHHQATPICDHVPNCCPTTLPDQPTHTSGGSSPGVLERVKLVGVIEVGVGLQGE